MRVEKKLRIIPDRMSEEERKYFWRNRKGKLIYTPVYEKYNNLFIDNILKETSIETAFTEFKDTAIFERYMLNAVQFSAAKSAAEGKLIQAEVFNEDKTVRSFSQFEKEAEKITDISQKTWLRVEYETQRRQCVTGEQFRRMMDDSDLYPYWIYKGMMDDRERPEHVELEGLVFRIGDPSGDACWPQNDWNCLKGDELVLTPNGWEEIQSLKIGQAVIGGSGNERKIRFVHVNEFDGQMVGISTKGGCCFYTDNHRVLTIKGWVASGDINTGDIIINLRKKGFFNVPINYINNCYSFGRYKLMSFIRKWKSGIVTAFNSNVKTRNIDVNPIRRDIKIVDSLITKSINMLNHFVFNVSRFCSVKNMFFGVKPVSILFSNRYFFSNIGPEEGRTNLLSLGLTHKPITSIFGFAKIWMGRSGNIFSHILACLFLPIVIIYPLCLYCIASVSDWYIAIIEKFWNNPVVKYVPSLTQLSERIKLNRIKFVENNGDGSPLDGFNSRYVFLYSAFVHFKMVEIVDVNLAKYFSNVYNLDVEKDNSYITRNGIVHNCRCEGEPIDDDYLNENKLRAANEKESKEYLENNVDEDFRTNAAIDGTLPQSGSYFEVLGSANEANYKTFDLEDIDSDEELKGLAARSFFDAKGMHFVIELVHQWKDEYQVNKKNEIIFQNEALRTNVRFTNNSLHEVQKHSRGLENLPSTIEKPDEIWSLWANKNEQRAVLRNYITFGKTCYIVQTKDGVITDSFAVSKKQANKYRKGVIL